jgi:predicted acyltransferase
VLYMVIAGLGHIALALVWNIWHPIVKHIWTSSFVLFSGGICLLLVVLFSWMVDYLNMQKGFSFFIVIGMNAIFAYLAAYLFDFGLIADVFLKGLEKYVGSFYGFIRALGGFSILYFIFYKMYKLKIFIKI